MVDLLQNKKSIRFITVDSQQRLTADSHWTIKRRNDDVYLSLAGLGAACKISFHASGFCQFALTDTLYSLNPPSPTGRRDIISWQISDFSNVLHTHFFSLVIFDDQPPNPRFTLGGNLQGIPHPPLGAATEVAFFASATDPREWTNSYWPERNILTVCDLTDSKYITGRVRIKPFDDLKRQATLARLQTTRMMYVGAKDPVVTAGFGPALLSEASQGFGTVYCVLGVSHQPIGARAVWHTDRANFGSE